MVVEFFEGLDGVLDEELFDHAAQLWADFELLAALELDHGFNGFVDEELDFERQRLDLVERLRDEPLP